MRDGTFKVFSNLVEIFEEKRLYHRDEHSNIVKERDDLLSAIRYAYMMRRNAVPMGSIKKLRVSNSCNGTQALHDFDPYDGTQAND